VLLAGPTVLILQMFIQNLGSYLGEIVSKTFNLYAYNPTDWLGGWTILYWGWWLSWSPFVGMFIARISRGRTIREFVLGAMLVPCGFTLLWMNIFGSSAIDLILHENLADFGAAVQDDQAVALFQFFEFISAPTLLSWLAVLMVMIFFITSADSGAMVINMLAAHGRDDTPRLQRVFWTVVITAITIALLLSGGLQALQTAAIASALPFSAALLLAIFGFAKALRIDATKRSLQTTNISMPYSGGDNEWRRRLDLLLELPGEQAVTDYLQRTVLPALREFSRELTQRGIANRVSDHITGDGMVQIEVEHGGVWDFVYQVCSRSHPRLAFEGQDTPLESMDREQKFYRAEVHLREGGQDYDIMGWSREHVLADILTQYEHHVHFLHALR